MYYTTGGARLTSLGSTLHPQGRAVAHPKVAALFYSVYLPSYGFMCEFDGIGLMN